MWYLSSRSYLVRKYNNTLYSNCCDFVLQKMMSNNKFTIGSVGSNVIGCYRYVNLPNPQESVGHDTTEAQSL